MKKQTVTLVNTINGEKWACDGFNNVVRTVDGEDFVLVYKPENSHRKFIMRKNVFKVERTKSTRKEAV